MNDRDRREGGDAVTKERYSTKERPTKMHEEGGEGGGKGEGGGEDQPRSALESSFSLTG